MGWLGPVFWVVILLGIMILVHELGHFWAALAVGIKVETFSIGFGPRLFGFRRNGTDFRFSAVLFGGYVRMLGELPGDQATSDPRSFQSKPRWQRAIVVVAGPLMNALLAIAIITGLYMYAFPKQVESAQPVITSIAPNSAAAAAGLRPGDKIVQIGGKHSPNWDEVMTQTAFSANHPLPVTVERKGRTLDFTVTPRPDPKEGIGVAGWGGEQNVQIDEVMSGTPAQAAGLRTGDLLMSVNGRPVVSPITLQQAVIHSNGKPIDLKLMRNGRAQAVSVTPVPSNDPKLPWHIGVSFKLRTQIVKLGFGPALVQSLRFNQQNATMFFKVLSSLAERRVSTRAVAGPIGIAQISNEAAQEGPWSFLFLMAIISLQLGILNLLPIPIMDGGTLLMLIVEMLLQREVSMQVKETIFKLGFVFLMMIVVFVFYNDISRILTNG